MSTALTGQVTHDAAETFIRENPTHPRIDYAWYLKGLNDFERVPNSLERWMGVDMTQRPPTGARDAFTSLRTVVQRYPEAEAQVVQTLRAPEAGAVSLGTEVLAKYGAGAGRAAGSWAGRSRVSTAPPVSGAASARRTRSAPGRVSSRRQSTAKK